MTVKLSYQTALAVCLPSPFPSPQLLMVISTILERNPELQSTTCMNLDEVRTLMIFDPRESTLICSLQLLHSAFNQLKQDVNQGRLQTEHTDSCSADQVKLPVPSHEL